MRICLLPSVGVKKQGSVTLNMLSETGTAVFSLGRDLNMLSETSNTLFSFDRNLCLLSVSETTFGSEDNKIYEPFSVKKRLNTFVKKIDSRQPAWRAQADIKHKTFELVVYIPFFFRAEVCRGEYCV